MKQSLDFAVDRPVGSGKTALTLALCKKLRNEYNLGMDCFSPGLASGLTVFSNGHQRYFHPRGSGVLNQEQSTS